MDLLSRICVNCESQLLHHTIYFLEDWSIDFEKPVKCPLGQASDWISWEQAVPQLFATKEIDTGGKL